MAAERVVAIVQARMGSTRLPGKTLAPFGDSTILGQILGRLGRASSLDDTWVATSTLPADDAIAELCAARGTPVTRGSADDVLARFADCIAAAGMPPLVLRVCADRPLLCPTLADELVAAYEELGRPDYVSNTLTRSYPDGLDLELVRAEHLLAAAAEAADPYEREHVTPFLYRRAERFRLEQLVCPFGDFSALDVALDTAEDYARLRRIRERLPDGDDHRDLLSLAAVEPELCA
jgi:spore coat polysaccharide biosynthesis protein SpsF (cytidylyltransferase family)